MRWMCCVVVALAGGVQADRTAGQEMIMGSILVHSDNEQYYGHGAPACAGSHYALAPGCCRCPPSACCDNIWDGYCQERARWVAFWDRVTAKKSYYEPIFGYRQPTPACHRPVVESSPPAYVDPVDPVDPGESVDPVRPAMPAESEAPVALPPLPRPAAEETIWLWHRPWLR